MSSAPPVPGMVDIHCHVLPGVDDGSPDLATSLEFLRSAALGGTSDIIATPHQHPGRYPNDPATLRAAHARLQEERQRAEAEGERLPAVHLGAEVHLDGDLAARCRGGEKLRLAGGPYLLLELPDVFAAPAVEDLLYRLRLDGTSPILAHPERNGQLLRDPTQLRRFIEMGALTQVTAHSVTGEFGEPCRRATETLLRGGLVHFVASDAHDLRRRTPSLAGARAAAAALLGAGQARVLLEDNPRAVLEGRALEPLPPPPPEDTGGPGSFGRLAKLLRRR